MSIDHTVIRLHPNEEAEAIVLEQNEAEEGLGNG